MKLTHEQVEQAKALIPAEGEGDIDAMELMRAFNKETGEHIDWHEFSYLLDNLQRTGFLRWSGKYGYDGFTRYERNPDYAPEIG